MSHKKLLSIEAKDELQQRQKNRNVCFDVLHVSTFFSDTESCWAWIGCSNAAARLQLIKMCLLTFLVANHYGEFPTEPRSMKRFCRLSMSIKFNVVSSSSLMFTLFCLAYLQIKENK